MSTFGLLDGAAVLRKIVRITALTATAALLASCGGGTQLEPFQAQRVLAFGDENSVITSGGLKYTVNALDASNSAVECASNPIWVQQVASAFGLVFPQCNPTNVSAPRSRIYAAPGAKVADLTAQVNAHLAGDSFSGKDLATIMVGRNDVLAIYAQYPAISVDQAKAAAEAAGAALAVQVNRIANAGGKVLLAKVLDLGKTPFGLKEKAAHTGVDRAALLTTLSERFNAKLRVDIMNDGRRIGLVQSDERIQAAISFPNEFGLTNVKDAACLSTVTMPNCTTATLGTDSTGNAANANTWLWADNLNLSAAGHFRVGEIAASVARNNPF
ncbi:SGNH/GDSL hydrolase family protein [Piscinibacter sakaiensis]|uniref:SGNH/GDSL hydrolase family protein n=1 Tax=Piscinibacter sakaiensis TaxID=1547922 RepID=UPI003AAB1801